MNGVRYEVDEKEVTETLTLYNEAVIGWFLSNATKPRQQDEWIQDVTGHDTASVDGHVMRTNPLELEIEYTYILRF